MRISTVLYLLLLIALSSCDGAMPAARFDTFPTHHSQDLTRVLGSNVTLISAQDTLTLQITFDPRTGLNTLRQGTTDTLLTAEVFRFRGLYYFVESLRDSSCWVHAVRIKQGQVQGLNTGYWQMDSLTSLIQKGSWPELIRYHSAARDSFRLRFDRRALREFYTTQVGRFPMYHIQPNSITQLQRSISQAASVAVPHLYPNPASRATTLDFHSGSRHEVKLYTAQGRLARSYSTTAARLVLPVSDLPTAAYFVRVSSSDSAHAVHTLRLIVEH